MRISIRDKSIAFKLRLYILTGLLLIYSAIMYIDYRISRRILLNNVTQNATHLALSTVHQIEKVLMAAQKIPQNLAPILENIDITEPQIRNFLKPIVEHNSEVFGSAVAFEPYSFDPDSYFFSPYYYAHDDSLIYKKLGGDEYVYFYLDWYQIPKMLNQPVWTEPYFDENGGNIIMSTYSVPFYKTREDTRQFAGIVTVDIDLSWLKGMIGSINITKTGYAFLISQRGTFITHPADSLIMNESIFSVAAEKGFADARRIGREMIAGKSGFINYNPFSADVDAWFHYSPLPSCNWSLGIVFPENELMADLNQQFKLLLLLGLSGIVLLFVVITLISKMITRPLVQLARISDIIGTGNFDVTLPEVRGNDEIGKLRNSFELMKQELKRYMENLRETTAIKERIESELKVAHDIQQSIIPKIFPPFPEREDVDVYAILNPAREVGGDLFDFFFVGETKLAFAIGDVSGKGVPASLFMAITRTLLRSKVFQNASSSQIVSRINKDLCQDNENTMFVTFFLGILDLQTGVIDYCNAGHNYPFILRADNSVEALDETHGAPLGLFEDMNYKGGSIKLDKQEFIILYTDGISEAMNIHGQLLGEERLELLMKELSIYNCPKIIINQLMEKVNEFSGDAEQSDDITLLVLGYYLKKDAPAFSCEKQLTITNKIEEIARVEKFIENTASEWKIDQDTLNELMVASEEIVSNIINYGYGDQADEQSILIAMIRDDQKIIITFKDNGAAFNPLRRENPDSIAKPLEERESGGLGIYFVKQLMDEVSYEREGRFNVLTIAKNIVQVNGD